MKLRPARRRLGVLTMATALAGALVAAPAAAEQEPTLRASSLTLVAAQSDEIEVRDLQAACPAGDVPSAGFSDAGQAFGPAINCLVWYDVTYGRGDGTYGTNGTVTRGHMALFLYRLIQYNLGEQEVPGADVQHDFNDVPAQEELTAAINSLSSDELAEFLDLDRPIVSGLGDGRFGPGRNVQRGQMASFIAATYEGLLTVYDGRIFFGGSCSFSDVDFGNVHRAGINTVCANGIATGTSDTTYAPSRPVTRGQMAAFLMRTQDILADEPFYALLPDQDVVRVDRDDCADAATHCTIQAGVDAAASGDRVLVVASEELYTENVNLGSGNRQLFGVPVADEDGQVFFPGIEGSITAGAADRLLLGRLAVLPAAGATGISVTGAGSVGISGVAVVHPFEGGVTGIDVDADSARLDAVDVRNSDVSVVLDVTSGDIIGSRLTQADDAFVVDVADNLDLEDILEREEYGLSNFIHPEAELGTFGGSPAIVPVG